MLLLALLLLRSAVFVSASRHNRRSALTKAVGATVSVTLLLVALSLTVYGPDEALISVGTVVVALSTLVTTVWEMVAITARQRAASNRS